jgi:hypothetical protein
MSSTHRPTGHHEPATAFSDRLPNQLITWWEHNFTGAGDSGHKGEWLRCLKATRARDRQLVWSGGAIAAIVTFARPIRGADRLIEGWGGVTRLASPVSRDQLLSDTRTAWRFEARGIKALQGLPIRIDDALARAILEMAGGVGATHIPLDEPDYSEEPILWAGPDGLEPELVIEAAVSSNRDLWQPLGFPSAPHRQVWLGPAGRADLLAGDVCGECKRTATVAALEQLERYLDYLERIHRRPRSQLRGLLLQCAEDASDAIIDRLHRSRFELELWSVWDEGFGCEAEQLG